MAVSFESPDTFRRNQCQRGVVRLLVDNSDFPVRMKKTRW